MFGKTEVFFLTNMHNPPPPVSGHFVDKEGTTLKPLCIEVCSSGMGFVDLNDVIANGYSISCEAWKWHKKLFHLLHLSILNVFIIHKTCGWKLTHKLFQEQLLGGLIHVTEVMSPHPLTSS